MRAPNAVWRRAVCVIATVLLASACGGSREGDEAGADPDPRRVGPQGRVAQFIVRCEVSHLGFDDPILLPWQPGASHQHQFFGNREADSNPGYEQAVGAETSCDQGLDTASYWSPTLLDATGARVDAVELTAYYRPGDGVAPEEVIAYPPGFMVIAGDQTADQPQSRDVVAWGCGAGARRDARPPSCPEHAGLRLWITFPDCWDASRLTGFGSSVHVRYSDDGCPESHPVALPQLVMAIDYPSVDPDGLSLSSGSIESAHADFWNTWDQDKLEREVELCLNRDLVCGVSD